MNTENTVKQQAEDFLNLFIDKRIYLDKLLLMRIKYPITEMEDRNGNLSKICSVGTITFPDGELLFEVKRLLFIVFKDYQIRLKIDYINNLHDLNDLFRSNT
jgi:hypothetical protein